MLKNISLRCMKKEHKAFPQIFLSRNCDQWALQKWQKLKHLKQIETSRDEKQQAEREIALLRKNHHLYRIAVFLDFQIQLLQNLHVLKSSFTDSLPVTRFSDNWRLLFIQTYLLISLSWLAEPWGKTIF